MNLPPPLTDWFASRGWSPRRHQIEMLAEAQRDLTPEQAAQKLREVSDVHYLET